MRQGRGRECTKYCNSFNRSPIYPSLPKSGQQNYIARRGRRTHREDRRDSYALLVIDNLNSYLSITAWEALRGNQSCWSAGGQPGPNWDASSSSMVTHVAGAPLLSRRTLEHVLLPGTLPGKNQLYDPEMKRVHAEMRGFRLQEGHAIVPGAFFHQ